MKRRRIYSRGTPKKRNRRSGIADKKPSPAEQQEMMMVERNEDSEKKSGGGYIKKPILADLFLFLISNFILNT